MQFAYSGGTAQQIDWVKEGIQSCRYPLDKIDQTVVFAWGALPSSDTNHPYMVTVVDGVGNITVHIAPWADDYTNPNNQGLPNPARDIKQFYMESVVHEIGHVVSACTFVGDPAKLQSMCSLFWTTEVTSGSGVRYGTVSDFGSNTGAWATLIKEAVADVFKCAFFSSPQSLIFQNRTQWNISADSWSVFLTLLSPINIFSGINWYGAGTSSKENGLAPGGILFTSPQGALTPIYSNGSLVKRSGRGHGTITTQGSSAYYTSESDVDFATVDSGGNWVINPAVAEVSQATGPGTYSPDGTVTESDLSALLPLAGTLDVRAGGGIGVSASSYALTLRLDFYRSGQPTGDYVSVDFNAIFNGPSSQNPTHTFSVTTSWSVGGMVNSGVLGTPLSFWQTVDPTNYEDSFRDLAFDLIFTQAPVATPYPFHEGTIGVGGGFRGAVMIGR